MTGPELGRRRFLGLVGGAGLLAFSGGLGACTTADSPKLTGPGRTLASRIPLPEPFRNPLPIPPVLRPVRSTADTDFYDMVQRTGTAQMLPGVRTTVWGYDGRFPGPTIEARSGRRAVVTVRNELPVPTSTHLHGAVSSPASDGYPTDLVTPAGFDPHLLMRHDHDAAPMARFEDYTLHARAKPYEYPFGQPAATLWYHDHRMDFSAPQVWRGLLGMCIVRDAEEDALGLPRGDKELPMVICDRSFAADGSLAYPALDPTLLGVPGVSEEFADGVLGDVMLVNGAAWPVCDVAATCYRLRLLNAGNARRISLALDPAPADGGPPFVQIGSDVGLLDRPRQLAEIPISPAERYDVVVDFSRYPVGSEIVLVNTQGAGRAREVAKFRVVRSEPETARVPEVLSPGARPRPVDRSTAVRTFDFRRGARGQPYHWTINGEGFAVSRFSAEIRREVIERWRFSSDFHHPVHVHLGHFQVLSRSARPPDPQDGGWKDTVDVRPYEVVEVAVRFTQHTGRYMIHCHNLEHEDHGMMANVRVL